MRIGVSGAEFSISISGFPGSRVQVCDLRVQGPGFRVQGPGWHLSRGHGLEGRISLLDIQWLGGRRALAPPCRGIPPLVQKKDEAFEAFNAFKI